MKTFIGIILILAGMLFGIYMGVWWAFIGGIVGIVQDMRAPDLDTLSLAVHILRVVLASVIGTFSAFVLIIPGFAFLNAPTSRRY